MRILPAKTLAVYSFLPFNVHCLFHFLFAYNTHISSTSNTLHPNAVNCLICALWTSRKNWRTSAKRKIWQAEAEEIPSNTPPLSAQNSTYFACNRFFHVIPATHVRLPYEMAASAHMHSCTHACRRNSNPLNFTYLSIELPLMTIEYGCKCDWKSKTTIEDVSLSPNSLILASKIRLIFGNTLQCSYYSSKTRWSLGKMSHKTDIVRKEVKTTKQNWRRACIRFKTMWNYIENPQQIQSKRSGKMRLWMEGGEEWEKKPIPVKSQRR